MGIIHKLDPHLVNQIAAGEVIERPASVVKELLENAVDAQAARIDVEVEEGGRKLIRVRDDGVGMGPEDLALSVASHATSKLAGPEDLDRIGSLGFRGEALASIASVSRLTVTTCPAGSVGGHSLTVEGGDIGEVRAAGTAPGTSVEVRNLFYNVPARRKFLKTDSTELGHVVDAVARVALAYPRVSFRVTHNGRAVHDLPAAETVRERVAAFFGRHLAESLIEISRATPAGELWGLAAPPSESRASTRMQFLFVNGRYVRDRSLLHAIREAYRGLLEHNRQSVVFIYLTVPPEDIDVNVHPTKIEVRLRNGQQVYRELLSGLRDRFLTADLAPRISGPSDGDDAQGLPASDAERQQRIRQSMADFLRAPPSGNAPRFEFRSGDRAPSGPPATAQSTPYAAPPRDVTDRPADATEEDRLPPSDAQQPAPPLAVRAVQLHNTYLVAETDEGMLIVDQHALHERVLYEELRARFGEGGIESQRLLIPAVVDVTPSELSLLEEHAEALRRIGIEFEAFGTASIGVQSFPSLLAGRAAPERVLRDLLDWAAENGSAPATEDVLDELLHRMACHAAVKAGDALSDDEIRSLLSKRDLAEQTATCPHGRPTALVLPREEIERQFKRDYRSITPEDDETLRP